MPAKRSTSATAPSAAPMVRYQQIKDFVAGKIQDGICPPGDRLPSENNLVQQFGMSRMTINRALRELQEHGPSAAWSAWAVL